MKPVQWSEELSVGVKLFDRQHQRLVSMLNKMIENPKATTRSETVADILSGMTHYALEHFKSEEDLMTEHGYPDLDMHRRQHQSFWEKLTVLCKDTTQGAEAVPRELLGFLQHWLTQHILDEDMAYKKFFEEKGVK